MIYNEAITGKRNLFQKGSPQSALQDFYQAFNARDLQKVSANWLQTEEASMSNPLGGVRRGWDEIAAVYQRLFAGEATVYVEFYDYSIHQSAQFFCAVGRERGYFEIAQQQLELAIRTSRIYHKQDGLWRQLHHHGSIEQPDLLKSYQTAVVNK
ncbi:MAG: nuclear transport factor 2 family protein [Gammaproteobacteria bacterium]|nr:nuclear transport factor 2 family protein [Gammaproteobacteria bacterium]